MAYSFTSDNTYMLELCDVAKRYQRRQIISGLSHRFGVGLTLLTGASGAGKSTLLRLIATAERPSGGVILWNGAAISQSPRRFRAALGYAPQAVDLPDDLTGREFLAYIAALKGLGAGQAERQAIDLADRLGIADAIDARIDGWSGGMRRRLVLLQALIGTPALLALDEPTAELDAETAARVEMLILERAEQAIVVMTSHLPERLTAHTAATLRIGDMA